MHAPEMTDERIAELARLGIPEDEFRRLLAAFTSGATMKAAAEGLRFKTEADALADPAFLGLVAEHVKRKAQGARGAVESTIAGLGWF